MVIRADVLGASLDAGSMKTIGGHACCSARACGAHSGTRAALASGDGVVLICGRFEGVDERIVAARNLEEISIGDYVLSGGEIAAMVVCDACVRLLPGVMGAEASSVEESF